MSYITPRRYRKLTDKIGAAYAVLRDTLNISAPDATEIHPGTNTVYGYAKYIQKEIVETSIDDNTTDTFTNDELVDPSGSIANDLGSAAYDFGTKFSTAEAKKISANHFGPIIKSLNSHVVKRTYTTSSVKTFAQYLAEFDVASPADADMSLFDELGTGVIDGSYYFSSDFSELCNQININLGGYTQ